MTNSDTQHLYQLYCQYTEKLNDALLVDGFPVTDPNTVSYVDFVAIWNSLPESRREFWRLRFEAGYDEVAKSERRKLATLFSSSVTSASVQNSFRAA